MEECKYSENTFYNFVQTYIGDELYSLAGNKETGTISLERYKGPNYTKHKLGQNWSRNYSEDKVPSTCQVIFNSLKRKYIERFFNPKFETIEISRKKIKGVTLRTNTLQAVRG